MTVTELIASIKAHYPTSASDATLIGYMNIAQDLLSAEGFGNLVEDVSITTVADQESYTFPTGLEDVDDIDYLALATIASPVSRYDYVKYRQGYSDESPYGRLYFQTVSSTGVKKLALYPIPDTTGLKIMIRFRKRLTALSASSMSTSPEFHSSFHDILVYYACYKICRMGQNPDFPQSNSFLEEYNSSKKDFWRKRMEREARTGSDSPANNTWKSRRKV